MNVANILPGDEVKVELSYTELLVPTDGVYEFAYPTVVGPRYSNRPESAAPAAEQWIKNPYLPEGESVPYQFEIKANISGGMPIQDLVSTSHKIDVSYADASSAEIILAPQETNGGNRDFILRYRLEGEKIQSGLLLSQGGEENFFLAMVEPPKRVATAEIPAREYIFVVDVSGSMYGFPLEVSKTLIGELLGRLRPIDRFNVLLFSGGSKVLSPQSLPATPDQIKHIGSILSQEHGGGGTELLPALKTALALPREENISRTIVVITDGFVDCESETFDLVRENLGRANLFAFGIGSSVNRFIIDGMARAGKGEPFVVTDANHAAPIAERFRRYIEQPVLTGVNVAFEGFDAYDIEPQSVPDMFAERPIVVFGKWRGAPKGRIRITGHTGTGSFEHRLEPAVVRIESSNALRYLWARSRIATLSDYAGVRGGHESAAAITALGLKYNLLTKNTSFIAVDEVIRNPSGQSNSVKQPLPLPQGVSNFAVGNAIGVAPEPETYLLLGVMGLFLLGAYRKTTMRKVS